jgi:hypothetical protein
VKPPLITPKLQQSTSCMPLANSIPACFAPRLHERFAVCRRLTLAVGKLLYVASALTLEFKSSSTCDRWSSTLLSMSISFNNTARTSSGGSRSRRDARFQRFNRAIPVHGYGAQIMLAHFRRQRIFPDSARLTPYCALMSNSLRIFSCKLKSC